MNCKKFVAVMVGLVLLSGCATFEVEPNVKAVSKVNPTTTSPFLRQLSGEYRDLAIFENNEMMDWRDANLYAKKGLMAAKGDMVMAEDPATRRLTKAKLAELQDARGRLVRALDGGARTRDPKTAAYAQAKYDCWVEQEEEGWQTWDIAACRGDFLRAMSMLDGAKYVEKPAPYMTAPAYMLFFDYNKSDITAAAKDVLTTLVADVKKNNITSIRIDGHADTSGSMTYNQALSERRARAVKDGLVAMGVPAGNITTAGHGETQPNVATGDGVREPANRRAELRFR